MPLQTRRCESWKRAKPEAGTRRAKFTVDDVGFLKRTGDTGQSPVMFKNISPTSKVPTCTSTIKLNKQTINTSCVLDTGSDYGALSQHCLNKTQLDQVLPHHQPVKGIDGVTCAAGKLIGNLKLGNIWFNNITFIIVKADIPAIVGLNVLFNESVRSIKFTREHLTLELTGTQHVTIPIRRGLIWSEAQPRTK